MNFVKVDIISFQKKLCWVKISLLVIDMLDVKNESIFYQKCC